MGKFFNMLIYKYKKKFLLFGFFLFFFGVFLFAENQTLLIKSFDDYEIKADFDFRNNSEDQKSFCYVFVNDLKQDKESWNIILAKMKKENYTTLVYNLREESYEEQRENRKLVNKKLGGFYDINKHIKDLDSIISYLKLNYNIQKNQIVLIGSRFGATIVLNLASGSRDINSMILISPRKDIKNNSLKSSIRVYGGRPIMMITSFLDKESNDTCLDYMANLSRNVNLNVKFYREKFSGLDFFKFDYILQDIMDWINYTSLK